VTSELQVVGKAASIAIQTWVRNNDKTKARAEEREKNIGWIGRLFTAWRVSHDERNERRAEREEAGEDDSEEDETPVVIPPSAVTIYPKGTPVPTPTVEVQVLETRVGLSNGMTWRQMIGVGVGNVVLGLREESSINSRGQNMPRGGRSYAERREKQREQGIGRRQRRLRTRPRRAMSQRMKQQERERGREWEEREVA